MADFTMYDREREFKWQIECQLRGGTNAYIDAEDIYSGRLTRQISSGEGIEVGSCYVSELDLTIVASALPANVVSVKPYFRLLTSTEIVDDVVRKYYTPYNLGVFKIASTKRKEYGRIDLVCYDKMADLDALITPAAYTELLASDWRPFYLLDWIATKVNVTYTFTQSGIEAMPNGTLYFKLAEETSNIKTYRDLLQYVCMLIGAYGIFDEDGHLNVKTFADVTSYSLPASFRFSESFGDVPISYSGVELTVKNVTTMFGNANNTVVRLSDNPFLYNLSTLNQTTDYATFIMLFLRNIYTEFQGLSYYAGEFEIPPDASLNVGRLLAVTGGGASDTINCFLQKIDVNFDGRMSLSCGNPNTYVTRTQNRTTSSIANLTNRIETLESSQGGNKIYTSKSAPDTTLGNEGDLWVKYFVDYNDKLINSLGNEVDINLPRYESADAAYNYVDLTIRPDIRSICNLPATAINAFVKGYEGKLSIAVYQLDNNAYNITASQFPQLTVDTYTINNQSFSVSNGTQQIGWDNNPIHYRYIGVSDYRYVPVTNMDDFNDNLSNSGQEIRVSYYYLYYNTSNKKFEYIQGYIINDIINHTYWSDSLDKYTSDVTIDLIDTAFLTIDKIYCKIGDDWVNYDGDGGSEVVVNQILQSGTEIAQISINGEVISIYAPETTVTQTLTEGTEIGEVNGTKLYAPNGGGSDVTVTPITTTGTNIANIAVNGTTYNLFAPTSGGGGGGSSGSGYTADLLFENTDFSVASGTSNVSLDYTLSASIDDYDAVIVSAFLVNKGTTREQVETIIINKSQYYTRAISSGTDDYNTRWAFKLNGTYQNTIRDLYFGFADNITLKTLCRRSNSGEEPKLYRVYGLKFGGSSGHNYSVNEQVVGTWIDGSALYECTYDLGSDLTLQDSTWTDSGVATPTNANRCIKAEGIQSNGTSTCIMASVTSTNISVQSTKNGGDTVRYITIQYTKTS